MSYLSTEGKLIGRFIVKQHARSRLKKRKGNVKIGNRKIKNMGAHKLNQLIIKSLKTRVKNVLEQDDGSLKVTTKDFQAIVMPGFHNHVITLY